MKKKIVNQIEVFILEVRGRRPFYARPDKRGSVPRRTLVLLVLLVCLEILVFLVLLVHLEFLEK